MLQAGNQYATASNPGAPSNGARASQWLHFFIERYREAYTSKWIVRLVARAGAADEPDFGYGLQACGWPWRPMRVCESAKVVDLD